MARAKTPIRKPKLRRAKVSPTVEIDPDLYGTYAQFSALADYVETAAFQHGSGSEIGLATVLEDINTLPKDQFDDALGKKQDTATDAASTVFSILAERAFLLGKAYPFDISGPRLSFQRRAEPYLALLSVSFLHAIKSKAQPLPTDEFENLVLQSLTFGSFKAQSIYERQPGTFRKRVEDVAVALMLPGPPSKLTARVGAKDEGIDVVAHCWLEDDRPGHWVLIAQATCGKSDIWERKAGEASPSYARHLFQLSTTPIPMIAVPHHIENRHLDYIQKKREHVLVLDRVKLTRLLSRGTVTTKLIDTLKQTSIAVSHDLAK